MSRRPNKSTTVRTFRQLERHAAQASLHTTRLALTTLSRVVPSAAVAAASELFVTPRRTRRRDKQRFLAEQGLELSIPRPRGPLRGLAWGPAEAPPVLLVHGWSGNASQLDAFVAPLVARGRRVLAFDLGGHGTSSGRHATIVSLAEDLLAIGDRMGPFAGVVAHSFGGPVTTVACLAGLAVKRGVFIAPPYDAADWLQRFTAWLAFGPETATALRHCLERRVGVAFADLDARRLVDTAPFPLRVIHDEDDLEVPLVDGEQLVAGWPRATLRKTRGLGHHRILRDPEVVRWTVDFITEEPS